MALPGHRHALLLSDGASSPGEATAAGRTVWDAPADACFGEPTVASASLALEACGADLLVVDWPPALGRPSVLAWSALEAMRRRAEGAVALRGQPAAQLPLVGAGAQEMPDGFLIHAERLDDAWPALWRGTYPHDLACPPSGPLVSVIVRSMDRPTLDAALDSVAWQTHRRVEVVVVNARGQGHRALGPSHDGVPVRMVTDPGGAPLPRPRAANAGLDAARGDLLLFLDDDDVLLPDHIAKLVGALSAAPDAVAAYADVDFGRADAEGWHSHHRFAADFDPVRLCFENYLPIHAVLFRRNLVDLGVRVDERLPLLEDWDLWLQCSSFGPFVRSPGVSARYHADSPGGSAVFEETAAARQSRATLFAKWHQRLSSERFVDVMVRLQSHYRGEAYATAQLRLARGEIAFLREVLAARDEEISSLREVLAARDVQAQTARDYADSLAAVLAARDQELAALRAETPLRALKRTLNRPRRER